MSSQDGLLSSPMFPAKCRAAFDLSLCWRVSPSGKWWVNLLATSKVSQNSFARKVWRPWPPLMSARIKGNMQSWKQLCLRRGFSLPWNWLSPGNARTWLCEWLEAVEETFCRSNEMIPWQIKMSLVKKLRYFRQTLSLIFCAGGLIVPRKHLNSGTTSVFS